MCLTLIYVCLTLLYVFLTLIHVCLTLIYAPLSGDERARSYLPPRGTTVLAPHLLGVAGVFVLT